MQKVNKNDRNKTSVLSLFLEHFNFIDNPDLLTIIIEIFIK